MDFLHVGMKVRDIERAARCYAVIAGARHPAVS
jgi:hypothetical protein